MARSLYNISTRLWCGLVADFNRQYRPDIVFWNIKEIHSASEKIMCMSNIQAHISARNNAVDGSWFQLI